MLFSIAPKKKKSELFNRETEFNTLEKDVESGRIILLDGLRRIGKTSLLKVFLNESDHFSIMIDCRAFEKNKRIERESFNRGISKAIEREFKTSKFKKFIGTFSEIGIGEISISLNNKIENEEPDISDILNDINYLMEKKEKKFIIAFDEAQFLRFYGRGGNEFLQIMAYAYDNLDNIVFILTGSEVGLLHDFMNVEDVEAPLYGRYINEITLERFKKEKSIEFLKKGFDETEIVISDNETEKAVDKLDGIVGYLSMFGYMALAEDDFDFNTNLARTSDMAEKIVKKEIQTLILKSLNYGYVLNAIAYGMDRFSKIKKYVENNFSSISDPTLSKILSGLKKQSFIDVEYIKTQKLYAFPDPVIKKVCEELTFEK